MSNYYVLDTNVVIENPLLINTFRDAIVVIPSIVLQEVDNFKRDDSLSRNARIFGHFMDELYDNGYEIPEINVRVLIDTTEPNPLTIRALGGDTPDNRIIGSAAKLSDDLKDVTLLSNDILVRVKARSVGVNASKFTSNNALSTPDEFYKGYELIELPGDMIDNLYTEKYLMISNELKKDIFPHMFLRITEINGNKTAVAKVSEDKSKMVLVNPDIPEVWGIKARNVEQRMALQLLLDPDIPLVVLTGGAGTGKTLLTLASGLASLDDRLYNKMTLSKPTIDSAKEIGFLPGNKDEKLAPYVQSYRDNLEVLITGGLLDEEQLGIEIEALNYLRGRTLPGLYFVIDEVQNLTKAEVKTIVSRAGEGTKIILMGDINQIDNPRLDAVNNGLSYVINKFKGSSLFGTVYLSKGVRSKLATEASERL